MKEFTIKIDCINYFSDYEELILYLKAINGIYDVKILEDKVVIFNIKYDDKLISDQIIFHEIEAFLKLQNYPCIYGFNRHSNKELISKKIEANICCEFCFGNIIYTLYEKNGIEKVESNFYDVFYGKNKKDKYYLLVYYDSNIINENNWEEILKEIMVYS